MSKRLVLQLDGSPVDFQVRRGLQHKPDSDYAWTIQDPDGFTLHICAEKGLYPGAGAPPPKK